MADKLEMDKGALKLLKKLGAGHFGEVWEGLWNDKVKVPIKILRERTILREAFLIKPEIMKKLITQIWYNCMRYVRAKSQFTSSPN